MSATGNLNGRSEKEIFFAALEQPSPDARAAFLEGACGKNPALRQRVEQLLADHFQQDDFLRNAAVEGAPTALVSSPVLEGPGTQIGRYKLLQKLGEGGFGVVYMAEQKEPVRRRVALKIIKLGMDTSQVVARFEAERQALALMDHPNIAKVLDAGATDTGRPYFVMELVKGVPITKYCDQEKQGTKDRLDLFIKVCHAIQHAHQKGIIHRDIKPSNIMVTLHDGVPVPKVIDFGIAKATQAELTERTIFTQYSQFIGTPAYMSPEQAEMSGLDIDTRSDIYSLGVLLYELLTGTTPFDRNELAQSGLDEMRRIIREREPAKPSTRLSQTLVAADASGRKRDDPDSSSSSSRKRLQELKGDLDWIVMKCLEKDRTRRYETANGLASDLKRHLDNEPVTACPPSTAYKFRKAFRRHKLVFSASAAVVAALVFGIGVSAWQTFKARQAQRAAELARKSEEQQRREADQQRVAAEASAAGERAQRSRVEALAYSTDMNLVLQAIEMNNLGRAQELLNRNGPQNGQPDRRGWEWRYLWNLSRSEEIATLGSHDRYVTSLAFSPSEDLLVSGDMEGKLRFWQWKERRPAGELEVGGRVQSVRFSPDGRWLAVRRDGLGCQIWNIATRSQIDEFKDTATGGIRGPAEFSPQGDLLALSSKDGTIRLWNVQTHSASATLSGHRAQVTALVFSHDGRTLYSAAEHSDPTVRIWDLSTRSEVGVLKGHTDWVTDLALSPDESLLASSSGDGSVRIWDLKQRSEKLRLAGNEPLAWDLKFSPDGRLLATCGANQRIHLWDTATWLPVQVLQGHLNEVWSIAFPPDGKVLASGGKDNTVKLWRAEPKREATHERSMPPGTMSVMPWSVQGRWFYVLQNGGLTLGDTRSLQDVKTIDLKTFQIDPSSITARVIEPSGQWLYVGDNTGAMQALELDTGRSTNLLAATGKPVDQVALSPDGKRLACADGGGTVRVLDTGANQPMISLPNAGNAFNCLAFSRDGLLLAGGTQKEQILIWDVRAANLRLRLSGHKDRLTDVAFSPDGSLLASGSWDGTAAVWDVASGKRSATLRAHLLGVNAVAFSLDGQRLAAGTGDGLVKLWNVADYQEVLTLTGHHDINYVAFLPGDETLVAGTEDSIQLWPAPSLDQIKSVETTDHSEKQLQ